MTALLDQRIPVAMLDVRVTLPPGQNDNGPLALIVGAVTDVVTVTVTDDDVAVVPDFVTLTA